MDAHATARRVSLLSPLLCLAASLPAQTAGGPLEQPLVSAPLPAGAPTAMARIDAGELRAHAVFLASDDLGGRYTGSPGQVKAAEYIAARFEELGLLPLGDRQGRERSYFQHYPLECVSLDPGRTAIELGQERVTEGFAVVPAKKGSRVEVRGELVFCGDGSPDEIPKGSFRKRIPLVVLSGDREPGLPRGMGSPRQEHRAAAILGELDKRGARLVVFCLLGEESRFAEALSARALIPGQPLLRFGNERTRWLEREDIAAVYASRPLSLRLLAHVGIEPDPLGGYRRHPTEHEPSGAVELAVTEDPRFRAANVVAWREGSHPALAKEAVVFSAHMDHLGTRIDGDPFNGADDNASGTATLLEIAEAVAAGDAPKRSIVLLAVSGEELGLWGSQFFVQSPAWKTNAIVANVNIDMIGRATDLSGAREIAVTPSPRNAAYSTLVRDTVPLARALGLSMTDGDRYWARSDHYNFVKRGIPAVFFCGGEHDDYHRVTDHVDKLDFTKIEAVARLAYWAGISAADAANEPKALGVQQDW